MKVYIHIPFCASRCSYCDFYTRTDQADKAAFLSALTTELHLRRTEIPEGEALETIYIGGGTPSQLSIRELHTLFNTIYGLYTIAHDAEITFEANPDDLTKAYVKELREVPINRISLGVQSLDNHELSSINRRHDALTTHVAIERLRDIGLQNISIDLIYGLPSQSIESWQNTLEEALKIHPPHISAYHLIYEEGTPMYRAVHEGRIKAVDEELSISFFDALMDKTISAGYDHYEISNFALSGYHSRHNASYWERLAYLGFGPSAHSYNGRDIRSYNPPDLDKYIMRLNKRMLPLVQEKLTIRDLYNEAIMCGLRTAHGISLSQLQAIAPQYVQDTIHRASRYIAQGLLVCDNLAPYAQGDRCIKLSRSGIFVSDGIMADLFAP